jgi:hypothetical protein
MHPRYEKSTGFLIIEWYEKKKDKSTATKHYFEQKPKKLQLHPIDPGQIVRVHFTGKMPGWMKDYCEKPEHKFSCEEVKQGDEIGWILVNWRSFKISEQPLISPNIKGAVKKLATKIDDVCADLRQSLLDNADIVSKNLGNYHDLFDPLGIKYRPEEIQGVEGCLVVDHTFFLERMEGETDEDYRSRFEFDGRLERLVKELVNPLPDPVNEETDDEESEKTVLTTTLDIDDLDMSNSLEAVEENELDLAGSLGSEDDEFDLTGSLEGSEFDDELDLSGALETTATEDELDLSGALSEGNDAEQESEVLKELQKDPSTVGPVVEMESEETKAAENPVECAEISPIESKASSVPSVEKKSVEETIPEYVVLDYSHKSSGVLEGQMSIF